MALTTEATSPGERSLVVQNARERSGVRSCLRTRRQKSMLSAGDANLGASHVEASLTITVGRQQPPIVRDREPMTAKRVGDASRVIDIGRHGVTARVFGGPVLPDPRGLLLGLQERQRATDDLTRDHGAREAQRVHDHRRRERTRIGDPVSTAEQLVAHPHIELAAWQLSSDEKDKRLSYRVRQPRVGGRVRMVRHHNARGKRAALTPGCGPTRADNLCCGLSRRHNWIADHRAGATA